MGDVTSHPLANQAEPCLFGSSLKTSLCEMYDHKAAFLLVKTVLHKNFIYSKQMIIRLLIVFTICFNFTNRRSFTKIKPDLSNFQ